MYRQKAVYAILAILILLVQVAPAVAVPVPSQLPAAPDSETTSSNPQTSESTATPEVERALAEAEMAVRQTQAARIQQELDALGDELEALNTEYFEESVKLSAIEGSLNESREKLRWYEAELEAQQRILNERVVDIYRHGRVEPLEALVNNASFKDVFSRLSLLLKIGEQDAELLQQMEEQRAKIEKAKNALDTLFNQQKEITTELEVKKTAIEDKIKQESELLASIDENTRSILEQAEAERQRKQAAIVNKLLAKKSYDRISLEPGTVAFEAIQYLGIPYVWGGENPEIGLDCSGLVLVVYRTFGIELPHYSRAQAKLGVPVDYDNLQAGDLVFFGHPIHHVGIYLGEGYYIHAPKRNDVVKISRMSDRRDHAGARRIISAIPAVPSIQSLPAAPSEEPIPPLPPLP